MYKILIATDGSDYSLNSLKKIIPMARAMEAKLTLLSIVEDMPRLKETTALSKEELSTLVRAVNNEAQESIKNAQKLFENAGVDVKTVIKKGKPAEKICQFADEEGYDLVVIGDTGRGGLEELFLGSVSNKVAHQAKTDVMIVKRKK